ncbi:universal stress protein [Mycobacterium sp. 1164985.4]|uniref:universal stress protein n=1 Tax=Mycobacterium sp. 1164985.4 TaxID=1834069 RepID=UPI000801C795|nr:universal stress protein [Mycobacterium sp. 1164985.4]OBK75650.1 universal stress protein UspA [Mycobacterium sp. 1164985.4]
MSKPGSDDTLPFVVGVDGSESAMAAAMWTADLATRFKAPLELVSGLSTAGTLLTDAAAAIRAAALAQQREVAGAVLESAEQNVRAAFPDLDVFALRSNVPAAELLADRSRTAQAIVVGSEAISPTAAMLVGSTTLAVAAHSACPVIAWRGGLNTLTSRPIVLGVDDPATSAAAFDAAFDFASRLGVGLRAVHAWSKPRFAPGLINPYLVDWDGFEALQWQGLLSVLEPWTKRYPDVEVTYFLEPEATSDVLLRHAEDSQLIVVGARRRNALAGTLLGSTSLNMLHHSPIPVMVCHGGSGDSTATSHDDRNASRRSDHGAHRSE